MNGKLEAGPVRDFNVMVDRDRASASLTVRLLDAPETLPCERGTTCIIHVIEGELLGASQGDTFVARRPFPLVPRGGAARVAIVRIV